MPCSRIGTLAAIVLPFLGGCEATNLYIAHDTVVGVNAAVNSNQTSGHVVIGYDRKFFAVVPKSVPRGEGKDGTEAMSALSCSELEVDGIFLTRFVENLATGEAGLKFADRISQDGNSGGFFQCYKGGSRQ